MRVRSTFLTLSLIIVWLSFWLYLMKLGSGREVTMPVYTVKQGENWVSLADKLKVPLLSLLNRNPDIRALRPGVGLNVPRIPTATQTLGGQGGKGQGGKAPLNLGGQGPPKPPGGKGGGGGNQLPIPPRYTPPPGKPFPPLPASWGGEGRASACKRSGTAPTQAGRSARPAEIAATTCLHSPQGADCFPSTCPSKHSSSTTNPTGGSGILRSPMGRRLWSNQRAAGFSRRTRHGYRHAAPAQTCLRIGWSIDAGGRQRRHRTCPSPNRHGGRFERSSRTIPRTGVGNGLWRASGPRARRHIYLDPHF